MNGTTIWLTNKEHLSTERFVKESLDRVTEEDKVLLEFLDIESSEDIVAGQGPYKIEGVVSYVPVKEEISDVYEPKSGVQTKEFSLEVETKKIISWSL